MTLPANWKSLSIEGLYLAVNDPARLSTPASTIEAIKQAVRGRGMSALQERATRKRMERCDSAARKEINSWIDERQAANAD